MNISNSVIFNVNYSSMINYSVLILPFPLQDTSMLFLGGLIVAVGLEETGLHRRISICVMMLVGAQPIM